MSGQDGNVSKSDKAEKNDELELFSNEEVNGEEKGEKVEGTVVNYLSNMYSKCHENVIMGLTPIVERFLYEWHKRSDKTVPKGCYHAVLTMEEYNEFDCWRKVDMERPEDDTNISSGIKHLKYGLKRQQQLK
ncbi:hypothetical protein ACROYT_G014884 [Oculina patagonica]